MINARILECFEVIEHGLAKGSPVVADFGIFVFQVNRFRFVELVIKKITVGKVGLDHYCVTRREFQSFKRSYDRLTRFSIEELIPREG